MNKDILLVTLNATYQHAAFGLRYLYANLKELQDRALVCEFTIAQDSRWIVEQIVKYRPKIIGFGVYIWNTKEIELVVASLKKIYPEGIIVLGGPEVSYETETQSLFHLSDFVIAGEADFLFYEFCKNQLSSSPETSSRVIRGLLPEISVIQLPYSYYSEEDIRNRTIYVEASRGCPYKCEYCLSSLDKAVRVFDLAIFLKNMDELIQKGVRSFKFVDRTFNLNIQTSLTILEFFLEKVAVGLFLHFEMVPDRLPEELKSTIQKFPPGSIQFEIGIQTWNPEVAKNVSRRQDYKKIRENLRFLREHSKVHTHADLIIGLPGETLESFAVGFDTLVDLDPDEIQVGHLKRLKGTPIVRHDKEFEMVYQNAPPFQILQTRDMDFLTLQKLVRFSKFWDLFANSGQFPKTLSWLKQQLAAQSFFFFFYEFSDKLHQRHPQGHGIALLKLTESLWILLSAIFPDKTDDIRNALKFDYTEVVRREIPKFLSGEASLQNLMRDKGSFPKRQQRHQSNRDQSIGV